VSKFAIYQTFKEGEIWHLIPLLSKVFFIHVEIDQINKLTSEKNITAKLDHND
jgi:hypothetical protein